MLAFMSYLLVGILDFNRVVIAINESRYYFVEMLQILPAVFILTSLIQTWVPTNTIMKYFGDGSGVKGYMFSFLIGSLSAGPIYAAFPVCKTLLKKGASIRNIMIILSSWAVVKVPMLINEAKFMGVQYMMVRWLLTVIAIVIMANVFSMVVKKKDVILSADEVGIDHAVCILCRQCLRKHPNVFYEEDNVIKIQSNVMMNESIKNSCPVGAIR